MALRPSVLRTAFSTTGYGTAYGHPPSGFPEFRPRDAFKFDNHPHWYVGHMSKGKVKIQNRLKDVDILLEVRDARAPFSSAQYELSRETNPDRTKRLVLLNKADLVTPNVAMATKNLIEEAGQPCLLTTATDNKNLVKIKHFAMENARSKHPRTLGLMLMVVGLPNVGKSTIVNGMKRIVFATARHQGGSGESKLTQGVKWTEAKSGKMPGLTRDVRFFQLSHWPRLYCYDTPGVSLMKKRNDPERNTKLALLNTMPDHFAGEVYLADYLLYRLNKDQVFDYVDELYLPGPTDDIRYLCAHISALMAQKGHMQVYQSETQSGAKFFIDLWRAGHIGLMCLDHIPNSGEIQQLRELKMQTEPPGPWGPPCYPEVQAGLELEKRGPLLPEGFNPKRGHSRSKR